MQKEINIENAMNIEGVKFIDVRSPLEFGEACIPGAVNIPLLDNEERKTIGTIYKQESPEKARFEALNMVSPRLPDIVGECKSLADKNPIVLYCWRGGMRSQAVASILDLVGVPYFRLAGGFKSYRKHVNKYFSQPLKHKAVVIHGLTGVGKTEVIVELQKRGISAIDLEGLANNRGSVFGSVGLDVQPSQKMFEGLLAEELKRLKPSGYVVVEGESRRIGRIILPEQLFSTMNDGLTILLYCPIESRIERIKKIYTDGPDRNVEGLISAVQALTKRLGKDKVNSLTEMISKNNFDEAIRILLVDYYDPLYKYPDHPDGDYDVSIQSKDPFLAADEIIDFLDRNRLLGR